MRQIRTTPLGATTFTIKVDRYEDGQMQGAVNSAFLPQPLEFKSMPQLFLMLDSLMDEDHSISSSPQLDTSFIPTLELEILFRQHHSWQGKVRLLDDSRDRSFKSVLELIEILDLLLGA